MTLVRGCGRCVDNFMLNISLTDWMHLTHFVFTVVEVSWIARFVLSSVIDADFFFILLFNHGCDMLLENLILLINPPLRLDWKSYDPSWLLLCILGCPLRLYSAAVFSIKLLYMQDFVTVQSHRGLNKDECYSWWMAVAFWRRDHIGHIYQIFIVASLSLVKNAISSSSEDMFDSLK